MSTDKYLITLVEIMIEVNSLNHVKGCRIVKRHPTTILCEGISCSSCAFHTESKKHPAVQLMNKSVQSK